MTLRDFFTLSPVSRHSSDSGALSSTGWPYFVAQQKLFVARIKTFVAWIKTFVARIKRFVARIKRFVPRNNMRDGRIGLPLRRDDVDDARNEKLDARISAIDGFDASLTPRGAMAIELDAIA